ncbi:MAG: fumarate/nitrate reduction transcriptional regulator Fnr [Burkholderiales bacterium]|nr:fumarate/nitrate reduction transcriptional regulator Fnr [Burkholderiales bacterium]
MKKYPIPLACSNCALRDLFLPVGLSRGDMDEIDQLVTTRRSVKRGEVLFHAGDPFASLFAVRSGFFKTQVTAPDGRDQVTGFQMAGELLGLDGIGQQQHHCDAIALEDSQVCEIPYVRLDEVSRKVAVMQQHLHKILSREIVRDQNVMMMLGSMRAEARVAAFLLNLIQRLQARGLSASTILLHMTREEIGSYLGLKLETISRAFSRFHQEGLLKVKQRDIQVLDEAGLHRLLNEKPC